MAQADEPINGLLNIKNLLATDEIYVARISTNQDCYILGADLIAAAKINNPMIKVVCPFNQTESIELAPLEAIQSGNIKSILLHCYFERNNQSRTELVTVSFTNSDTSLSEGIANTIPKTITDLGISLDCDEYQALHLKISVDNSSSNNVIMYYNIISTLTL